MSQKGRTICIGVVVINVYKRFLFFYKNNFVVYFSNVFVIFFQRFLIFKNVAQSV